MNESVLEISRDWIIIGKPDILPIGAEPAPGSKDDDGSPWLMSALRRGLRGVHSRAWLGIPVLPLSIGTWDDANRRHIAAMIA